MEPSANKDNPDRPRLDPDTGSIGAEEDEILPEKGGARDSRTPQGLTEEESDLEKPPESDLDPANQDNAEENSPSFFPHYSRKDLIWMGALALAIAAVIIIASGLFFGNVNTRLADDADFPVRGENIVIKDIETYWRKPDREKDIGIQLNAKFVPAAEVTLKSSGDGVLRFFFENPEGELVGDPVTRTFSGASFRDTGEKTTHVHSTGGIEDLGDYNEYLTEKIDFWHLIVKEGADLESSASSYKEIIRMRLSPKRR